MREWKRDGYVIQELEHEGPLHRFVIITPGARLSIIPDDLDHQAHIIKVLDSGGDLEA